MLDDKGNYDYHDINQITISGIDSLIRCDQMDLLHIPVTLEGTQYADTNRFTYFWEINRKIVSTAKDLNVYVNFPLGENEARFVVTDKELGTKAFKYFKMGYASAVSWVIFAMILVVTLLLFRFSSGRVYYEDGGDF